MASLMLEDTGRDLLAKHAAWWKRESSLLTAVPSAALGDLWLPLADGTVARQDIDVHPEMLDLDRLVGPQLAPGPVEAQGDLLCTVAPYARVPWVEAILGTPIRATIQGGSMRTIAFVDTWEDWQERPAHRSEAWFDLLKRLTEMHVARSGGRRAVAQTLMRGPCDLAEAVLGPELMCFSMYDNPASLRDFLRETVIFTQIAALTTLISSCIITFHNYLY